MKFIALLKYILFITGCALLFIASTLPVEAFSVTVNEDDGENKYSVSLIAEPLADSTAAKIRFTVQGATIVDFEVINREDLLVIGTCEGGTEFTINKGCIDLASTSGAEIRSGDVLAYLTLNPSESPREVKIIKSNDNAYLLENETLYFDSGTLLPFSQLRELDSRIYLYIAVLLGAILLIGFGGALLLSKIRKNSEGVYLDKRSRWDLDQADIMHMTGIILVGLAVLVVVSAAGYLRRSEDIAPSDSAARVIPTWTPPPLNLETITICPVEWVPDDRNVSCDFYGINNLQAAINAVQSDEYTIRLPAGNYVYDRGNKNASFLGVIQNVELRIQGDGANVTRITASDNVNGSDGLLVGENALVKISGITFQNFNSAELEGEDPSICVQSDTLACGNGQAINNRGTSEVSDIVLINNNYGVSNEGVFTAKYLQIDESIDYGIRSLEGSRVSLRNSMITDTKKGPGLFIGEGAGVLYLENSLFAYSKGSGIEVVDMDSMINLQIFNSIAYANANGFKFDNYEDLRANYLFSNNLSFANENSNYNFDKDPTNLEQDPLFINPVEGDFRLQKLSPALNAGKDGSVDPDETRADIGYYGGYYGPQPNGEITELSPGRVKFKAQDLDRDLERIEVFIALKPEIVNADTKLDWRPVKTEFCFYNDTECITEINIQNSDDYSALIKAVGDAANKEHYLTFNVYDRPDRFGRRNICTGNYKTSPINELWTKKDLIGQDLPDYFFDCVNDDVKSDFITIVPENSFPTPRPTAILSDSGETEPEPYDIQVQAFCRNPDTDLYFPLGGNVTLKTGAEIVDRAVVADGAVYQYSDFEHENMNLTYLLESTERDPRLANVIFTEADVNPDICRSEPTQSEINDRIGAKISNCRASDWPIAKNARNLLVTFLFDCANVPPTGTPVPTMKDVEECEKFAFSLGENPEVIDTVNPGMEYGYIIFLPEPNDNPYSLYFYDELPAGVEFVSGIPTSSSCIMVMDFPSGGLTFENESVLGVADKREVTNYTTAVIIFSIGSFTSLMVGLIILKNNDKLKQGRYSIIIKVVGFFGGGAVLIGVLIFAQKYNTTLEQEDINVLADTQIDKVLCEVPRGAREAAFVVKVKDGADTPDPETVSAFTNRAYVQIKGFDTLEFETVGLCTNNVDYNAPDYTPPDPTATQAPSSTPTLTPTPTATVDPTDPPDGLICGPIDVNGDGDLSLVDFSDFARMYGDGGGVCIESESDYAAYGPCGGKDTNRDGNFNIADFGGAEGVSFASRYNHVDASGQQSCEYF